MEPTENIFTIRFKEFEKSFSSFNETYDWTIKEADFWREISRYNILHTNTNNQIATFTNSFQRSSNAESHQIQADGKLSDEEKFSRLQELLNRNYFNNSAIFSAETCEYTHLKKIIEIESEQQNQYISKNAAPYIIATYAYAYLKEITVRLGQNSNHISEFVKGSFYAHDFLKGDDNTVISVEEKLKSLKDNFIDWKKQERTDLSNLKENFDAQISEAEKNSRAQQEIFDSSFDENQNTFTDFINDSKEKLKHLEESYDDLLRLKSSVTYWKRQKTIYKNKNLCSAILFYSYITLLIVTVVITMGFFGYSLYEWPEEIKKVCDEVAKVKPIVIGFGSILIVLLLWVARMLARMYISNKHLYENTEQREIMIQTFLAMKNKDQVIEEEDRAYILSYLFKPTGDGLVKDEGLPSPLVDMITKIKLQH